MGLLVMVGVVTSMLAVAAIAHTTNTKFSEAAGAVIVGVLLYSFAVLAVLYPAARLLGLNQVNHDRFYFAIFFDVPGLLVTLLAVGLLRRLLSR